MTGVVNAKAAWGYQQIGVDQQGPTSKIINVLAFYCFLWLFTELFAVFIADRSVSFAPTVVIASDSYRFRLFAGVIASDSYRSQLAGQRYRFTLLSLWATYEVVIASREATSIILAITLPSYSAIPLPNCREKKDNSVQKLFFYCKIFKRTLLFLHYHITLYPKVETLSLHIVIALYRYRFGHMCTRYCLVPLSPQLNW